MYLWKCVCISLLDGLLRNVSVITRCTSSTSMGSSATVILNASQIVETPGNPTITVMWRWEDNDKLVSGSVSGQYGNFLNVTVTRDVRLQEIIALYDNTISHTMQAFNLQ